MEITREEMAYTEVLNVLNYIEKEYFDKVPKKLIDFFEKNSLEYPMCFDANGNFKVSKLAEEILCYINLEYWCDQKEKEKLIEIYKKNDEKYSEAYDIKKVFQNRKNKEISKENEDLDKNTMLNNQNSLIEIKENLFQKIINKIKNFFKRQ